MQIIYQWKQLNVIIDIVIKWLIVIIWLITSLPLSKNDHIKCLRQWKCFYSESSLMWLVMLLSISYCDHLVTTTNLSMYKSGYMKC